ncbi:MAG: 4Fe-4S dicluster domain-containing protein [Planctomycetes bacterium]|nr:4Fe-4S dicluster domain-containing protein [Planctomycetota bacterium]
MRRQRFGTFVGGLDLPDEKHATLNQDIEPIPIPEALHVPADPCLLGGVTVLVRPGQRVADGDRLAVAGGGQMPIYAPTGGVVAGVGRCRLAGRPHGTDLDTYAYECPSVELTDLTPLEDAGRAEAPLPWQDAAPEGILDHLAAGGLTTCTCPPEPLASWCRRHRRAGVDVLIINGLENEPYLTCEHRLMATRGESIVTAAAVVARALGVGRTALAVDARRIDRYRAMALAAERRGIQSLAVEHKYPMGNPTMLTAVVTGRIPPPGRSPMHVGVAVLNVAACAAVHRWVVTGRPPTWRVVTVSGVNVRRGGNRLVPMGLAASDLLAACGAPVEGNFCHGGPMTGTALPDDAVVGPATSALLSLPAADERSATACIRCGWCTDHCPVRLDVASLNDMYELGDLERARRYEVTACLGCGVCSYVCPARWPLTHRVRTLAALVRRDGPAEEYAGD